jgi:putative transferase (TIGR04331 family)
MSIGFVMSKEEKFLITTALEETWVDDQPVLFLGEWCRLYNRESRWSKMNAKVLPHHWENRDKYYSDYLYLNNFYECVLVDLANRLNQIHDVNHSVRYWRILTGPWLAVFIQILFDRWTSIQNAVQEFKITGTISLIGNEEKLIPNDILDFFYLTYGDSWNHQIYIEVLNKFGINNIIEKVAESEVGLKKAGQRRPSIINKALSVYTGISKFLVKDDDIFVIGSYLSKIDEIRLQLKFNRFPQRWKSVEPVNVQMDELQRNWVMPNHGSNDFEQFLLTMIPKQIPKVFLEGYKQVNKQIQRLPWPPSPKLIFTANNLWADAVCMAYTAEKVDQGTPLITMQHGGVYGTAKFEFGEDHEISIANRFLTWGHCNKLNPNIVAVGKQKKDDVVNGSFNKKEKLLLITYWSVRYPRSLGSENNHSILNQLENVMTFTDSMSIKIQEKCLVRLVAMEFGWNFPERWRNRFPAIKIDVGYLNFYELMKESRIVVCTYNSTTILEALSQGIPSVMFFDPKITPIREAADSYYAELHRVGILHYTSEAAAAHVNAVWDNVDAWWSSVEVQRVVAYFIKQYCNQADNTLDSLEAVFRDLIAESDNNKINAN